MPRTCHSSLESSSYCTFTWCRVKFPGSQCLGTGMTPLGTAVIKEPVSAT
ncbi:hypothetical protein [Wolbachia endosymbiont (group A) of Anomoia purmunda]|nr:hypothetical protein [Wolbachia endosymbiont (group A) of Anomoia purmunda]